MKAIVPTCMIKAAAVCAKKSKVEGDVLAGVNVRLEGGALTVAATDSTRLVVLRSAYKYKGVEDGEVTVPSDLLKQLVKVKEGFVALEVEAVGSRRDVRATPQGGPGFDWLRLANSSFMGTDRAARYPDYGRLIPKGTRCDAVGMIGVDPMKLADLGKMCGYLAKRGEAYLTDMRGSCKPILFEAKFPACSLKYILMPLQLQGEWKDRSDALGAADAAGAAPADAEAAS